MRRHDTARFLIGNHPVQVRHRIAHPGEFAPDRLIGNVQAQHIAHAQHAFAFDPGCHAAPTFSGLLEAPAEPGDMRVDHLGGQMAGAVLHVHDQATPSVPCSAPTGEDG